jgi:hypothetical protein
VGGLRAEAVLGHLAGGEVGDVARPRELDAVHAQPRREERGQAGGGDAWPPAAESVRRAPPCTFDSRREPLL